MSDYYSILGVQKTASDDEIKKAYLKLARKYHPDANPDSKDKASESFKECAKAYEILGDKKKRAEYDRYGSVDDSPIPQRDPFADFFSNMFNNMHTGSDPGEHIITQVYITLDQVEAGCDVQVSYMRKGVCATCDGKGGEQGTCRRCNGQGVETIHGGQGIHQRGCPDCRGTGRFLGKKCSGCNGCGYDEPYQEDVTVAIPPSIEHKAQMMFKGLGNPGRQGGRVGHLYVTINVIDHPVYTRMSNGNLIAKVPVTYTQLVAGDTVEIPGLNGKKIEFRIPPATQPGTRIRMSKQGLPTNHTQGSHPEPLNPGDMYVELKLEIPTKLNPEMIEFVEKMAKYDMDFDYYPIRKKFFSK